MKRMLFLGIASAFAIAGTISAWWIVLGFVLLFVLPWLACSSLVFMMLLGFTRYERRQYLSRLNWKK